ncbi:ABC transporter permease [Alloacidobacterium sp.]|uniref:ABC transporter permease n=1 Tax=Alloacidobacterium sp. TaxID=2951999 RepID=UPI002D2F7333|nr:ABC transporter permease [Alloacidobacterium sp.]HYK34881.1 ABC transporter permease [Alloacidobacterium sp.]
MSTLLLDLKFAFRQLRKSPGFAATAILMLAFGIGATTAIFSIVDGVLLRPLPFPESDRLMVLADRIQGADVGGSGEAGVTVPDIRAYTRDTHSFTSLGGYQNAGYELSGHGDPAQVNAARLTGGVLPALGVSPLLGRYFTQQEDDQSASVVVLSYTTWQSRFHGDANILGTKILLDRKPYLVIGVMPRNFEFPLTSGHLNRIELWTPMSFRPDELSPNSAANWSYQMVGRLKPGVTPAQAQNDAERVAQDIMRNYPAYMASLHISSVVRPLQEETIEGARPLVRTLFFAVAIVLLIACANLAGLLLVRAIRRQREVAVRLALGARSAALLRQAILESMILSILGGLLGIVLAGVALSVGKNLLPESLPRVSEISLNWVVVVFALLLAVITGFVCGLAPAFAALRTSVNETLKEGGRSGSAGGSHARLRSVLVIAEIAIALILLTASGLLLRSFEKMRSIDLGYQPDHIATAAYSMPLKQYATQPAVDTFNKELLLRLRQLPGVQAVGLTSFLPAAGNNNNQAFVPEGYVPRKGENMSLATVGAVMGDYFAAMKIPLLRGRYLADSDTAETQLAVVVNRKLAEHYWPNQDPIGKRLRIGTSGMLTPWLTIVGEIADVKLNSPDDATKEQYYMTVDQTEKAIGSLAQTTDLNGNGGYIVVRAALPPENMENGLRSVVRSIDPQLALTQVQTMQQNLSDTEAPRRFNTAIISAFAAAAVLLAVLGIYSVIAFSVAARVQEMAIRMALGSQRAGIIGLILISGTKLAAIGCVIGLLGAAGASGLLRSFLFGVSPFDPLVLTLAAISVLLLALVASALPAMRAASIDPMQSLRGE